MKLRATILTTAALAAALAVPAGAATGHAAAAKPVCKIVTDPTGDAKADPAGATVNDDGLDVVSGDIATNATTLTAVVRVASLASAADPEAPLGAQFTVLASLKGSDFQLFFAAGRYPNANKFDWGYFDTTQTPNTYVTVGAASGIFDSAINEVRISVPIADINKAKHGVISKGGKITGITIETGRFTGQQVVDRPAPLPSAVPFFHGLISAIDTTDGSGKYTIGAPSCVKVGS